MGHFDHLPKNFYNEVLDRYADIGKGVHSRNARMAEKTAIRFLRDFGLFIRVFLSGVVFGAPLITR